ncbi:DUF3429 domain-containing protein [Rhizobium oryzicola]|uniref:DUF3429 domain-containing protein n=1 Tax=Rhizobium oryzicola TaxID=1232668 RepID=A0ABT8SV25_9HYPH|nr:DUF3429 domain-containing protein [Rhizobium oryzicola]MDO1582206.1 DUF3429 domain-containing protein [Rhizobium oryzicola]
MNLSSISLTGLLTFSGAIPFAVLAIPHLPLIDEAQRVNALLAYGAVIASFMAGSLWGLVQRDGQPPAGILIASNVAALLAWATLLMAPGRMALMIQFVVFAGLLLVDRELTSASQEPRWYWDMRIRITAIVSACYVAAILFL